MDKVKTLFAALGSGMVLALASAGVASADVTGTITCTAGGSVSNGGCSLDQTDESTTLTVSGNCSGIFQLGDVDLDANGNDSDTGGAGNGGFGNDDNTNTTGSSTQTITQSYSFNFSPTCNVAAAAGGQGAGGAGAGEAAQVDAPVGGAGAGAGGAISAVSGASALMGMSGSVLAAGLGLRNKRF